jgi:hypothetical protein
LLRLLFLLTALLPAAALAGDSSVDIGKIEGIYRKRFQNSDTGGNRFMSTDELQIVQIDKNSAYFSVGLSFYNDHACGLYGTASVENGALVYRNGDRGPAELCELQIKRARGVISLSDVGGHCRYSCGARGGYNGAEFRISSRRKIGPKQRRKLLADAKEFDEILAASTRKTEQKPP